MMAQEFFFFLFIVESLASGISCRKNGGKVRIFAQRNPFPFREVNAHLGAFRELLPLIYSYSDSVFPNEMEIDQVSMEMCIKSCNY